MREQLEGIVVKWFNKTVNIVTVAAHHADSHYFCVVILMLCLIGVKIKLNF